MPKPATLLDKPHSCSRSTKHAKSICVCTNPNIFHNKCIIIIYNVQVEKQMENLAVRAQKELILLHRDDEDQPKNTVEWLNLRDWCTSHHHIRCPKRLFSKRTANKQVITGSWHVLTDNRIG